MITTKEVKIKQADDFNSEYIETELKNMGFDVLRWAVTKIENGYYALNIAVVQD